MYVMIIMLIGKRLQTMAIMTGEYFHQLDAKNRMRIPAKLKKELGDEYYFCAGTNHCITVLSKDEVQVWLDKLSAVKYSNLENQKTVRRITRTMVSAVEDAQGRVVLPPSLREHALMGKDDKDLVICGVINRIEIWSKKVHDEYFDENEDFDTGVSKLTDF